MHRGIYKLVILILSTAVFCGCAAPKQPSVEDAQLTATATADGTKRLETLEPLALAVSRDHAVRMGRVLNLMLTNNAMLRLENGKGDCTYTAADCLHYIFGADLRDRHAYLVFGARYEGGDWFLIDDRTGRRTQIDAVPSFSPDNTRFLILAQDEAYSSFFGIEIWQRSGDTAVEEWSHALGADAPEFGGKEPPFCPGLTVGENAVWRGNETISLDLHSLGFDNCIEHRWTATIEHGANGWRLVTDWPRGGEARYNPESNTTGGLP